MQIKFYELNKMEESLVLNNIYIGIDPGLAGGIAIIIDSDNYIVYDMPIIKVGKYNKLVPRMIRDIITGSITGNTYKSENCFCVIEKSQAMPGQGVCSMHTIGLNYGIIVGILACLGIEYIEISSRKWQKEFFEPGDTKVKSVNIASNLFPKCEFVTKRGRKIDGRADAMLMAEYGRRVKEPKKV